MKIGSIGNMVAHAREENKNKDEDWFYQKYGCTYITKHDATSVFGMASIGFSFLHELLHCSCIVHHCSVKPEEPKNWFRWLHLFLSSFCFSAGF
jgi:hypothetical protein